jgi:hypothetical protein
VTSSESRDELANYIGGFYDLPIPFSTPQESVFLKYRSTLVYYYYYCGLHPTFQRRVAPSRFVEFSQLSLPSHTTSVFPSPCPSQVRRPSACVLRRHADGFYSFAVESPPPKLLSRAPGTPSSKRACRILTVCFLCHFSLLVSGQELAQRGASASVRPSWLLGFALPPSSPLLSHIYSFNALRSRSFSLVLDHYFIASS